MKETVYLIQCPPQWTKTPPLGLEYIKSYLKFRNIEVKIIDLNIITYKLLKATRKNWLTLNEDFERNLFSIVKERVPNLLRNLIKEIKKASLIGISLFKQNKYFSFDLARVLKRLYPQIPLVFGGPHTLFIRLYKEKFSDGFKWIIGEGEESLYNIIKGETRNIIEYQEIDDIDRIPFLEFDDFNISTYGNSLPLISSRGCIKKCQFCTERLLFKKFRQHSPRYIVDQIKYLLLKHNTAYFIFQDSLINANLRWLEEFCTLVIKDKLNIKWEAQAIVRADFPPKLAQLMKKSGCFNLFVGLESASDKVLKNMNKGFTQTEAIKFFRTLRKEELHFEISIITGYPQETNKDFMETINFIVKNKQIIPKVAQVNPYLDYFTKGYTPYPIALQRVNKLVETIRKEKIPYTKSFINNLFYHNAS